MNEKIESCIARLENLIMKITKDMSACLADSHEKQHLMELQIKAEAALLSAIDMLGRMEKEEHR